MNRMDLHSPKAKRGNLYERFDSWIKQTLKHMISNEVRTYYRNYRKVREIPMDEEVMNGSYDPFEEKDMEIIFGDSSITIRDERLANALGKLGTRKQQVLEGTIIFGMPVGEVARELNLDTQTVSNYKYESLKILRKMMEDDPDE